MSALQGIVAQRLELTQRERLALKEELDVLDVKVQRAIGQVGTRPRESEQTLDAAMAQLEKIHNTTSQNNTEEREFMRSMKKMQERRKEVAEYNALQASLDELKSLRAAVRKDLAEKDLQLEELYVASRKLKMSAKSGCAPGEIVEHKVSVPEGKIAQVIGKGGTQLRQIEEACQVLINTQGDTTLRITGTTAGIAAAEDAIAIIVNTATEEFSPPDATLVALIIDKAARVKDLESRHTVRIDVSRAKRVCKISGQSEAVRAAVAEVQAIASSRLELPVDVSVLPFIVGKGGTTIRALGDEHKVHIDIDRESNKIVVMGCRADVDTAAMALRGIISDNAEVEETIVADKRTMYGCIIGNGGQHIRNLQKEFNVQLRAERGAENGDPEKLVIRGTTSRVLPAIAKIHELIAAFHASSVAIELPDDVVAAVVGKKGARIVALRGQFPDATIDVDTGGAKGTGTVRVHSGSAETRQAVRDALDAIVAANFSRSVAIDFDRGVQMKGPRGADTRAKLTTELGLSVDILPEEGYLKLRGPQAQVDQGVEIIEAFMRDHYFVDIPCSEDDFAALLGPGAEGLTAPLKAIEATHGVEMRASRKEGTVRVRGVKVAVAGARTALLGLLHGDLRQSSQVFPVPAHAFQFVIGKGGATLKKLEKETAAAVDILKRRSRIRVRAATPQQALTSRGVLLTFVDDIRTTTTIDVEPFLPHAAAAAATADATAVAATTSDAADADAAGAASAADGSTHGPKLDVSEQQRIIRLFESTAALYGIDLSRDKGGRATTATVRGPLRLIEGATEHLRERLSAALDVAVALPPGMGVAARKAQGPMFEALRKAHHVRVTVAADGEATVAVDDAEEADDGSDPENDDTKAAAAGGLAVRISGPAAAVLAARSDLWSTLETAFPGAVATVPLPAGCVRDVDTYRFKMDVELRAGGAVVLVDRTSSCARLLADSPDMARRAADAVHAKVAKWEETHATLAVHEYMLASLVGKNGTAILGLQKELQVGIQLNRTSVPMQLEIEAPDKTTLDAAMASLAETVKNLRRGHWSVAVDPELIGLLIGKQGANIIKLRTETGASIEVDRRTGTIEVNGDEDKVAKARAHVEAFVEEHKETACSAQVRVPAAAFPLVIGTKGAMAMEISETSGAKFDLDRVHEVAMLKGTKEACQKAVEMIQALLERAGFPTSNKPVPAKAGAEEGNEEGSAPVVAHEGNGLLVNGQSGPGGGGGGGTAARAGPRVLPGATPAMVAKMQEQAMSKSAARRKRRKEQLQQEEQQDEDEEEQEEERADDADGGDDDDDDGAGVDGDGDDDVDDEDESAHFAQAEPFARSLPLLPHHGLAGGGGGGVRTEHSLENGVAPLHHTTASPVGVIGRSTFSSPGTAAATAATAATAAATAVGVSPKPFDLPAVSPTARDYLDAQTGSDDHFRAPAYEAPAALAAALHGTTAFNQPPLGLGGFPPPPGLGPAGLIGIAPLPLGYAAAPPRSPAPVSTLGGAPISPVASGILSGLVGGLGGLAPPLTAAGHPAAAPQQQPQPRTPAPQPPQLQQNATTEQLLSMILGAAPLPLPATAKSSSTSTSSLPLPATTNQPAASVGATARAPAGAATTHTNGIQPQQRPPPARQAQMTTTANTTSTNNNSTKHFLSKSGFAVRL